jgi:DNA-binding response OmpR family regulator
MVQNKTVLIVENEPAIYMVLDRLLVANGYYTAIAGTSKQALSFLKMISFDLITLNLRLDDAHGNVFLEEMAKLRLDIPVIVVSGNVEELMPTTQVKAMLCKPFTAQEFLAVITQYIGPALD